MSVSVHFARPHLQLVEDDGPPLPLPPHSFVASSTRLWHYTDTYGAQGILEGQRFWASSASLMNDAAEITFGLEAMRFALECWQPRDGAALEAVTLVRHYGGVLQDDLQPAALFVLSASRSEVLLNQWMNYANVSGYALELTAEPLVVAGDLPRSTELVPSWMYVVYGWDEAVQHARSVLDGLVAPGGVLARLLELGQDPDNFLRVQLTVLAASMKHAGFAAEQEARFLVAAPDQSVVQYRPSTRGILPYVELELPADARSRSTRGNRAGTPWRLPLWSVIVGPPESTAERRTAAFESYKLAMGWPITVDSSGIPWV